jgi:hypothetical protein
MEEVQEEKKRLLYLVEAFYYGLVVPSKTFGVLAEDFRSFGAFLAGPALRLTHRIIVGSGIGEVSGDRHC